MDILKKSMQYRKKENPLLRAAGKLAAEREKQLADRMERFVQSLDYSGLQEDIRAVRRQIEEKLI